ncbi:MAG TPA: aldose epimerase family protein [Saprospiraceae bacterium]|nr:aldose epimerase family protein [Saprospiraceae bacterium]
MDLQKKISKHDFGTMPDGRIIEKFTLHNANGMEVDIIPYGGSITGIRVPDRQGVLGDVVLGFDDLATYLRHDAYFGAIVGRFANRIGGGKLVLDAVQYQLPINLPPNHLHGGKLGFGRKVWEAKIPFHSENPCIELHYHSRDMEEGYPGNLEIKTTYSLTDENELEMVTEATTDKKTVINITYHPYFNLTGKPDQLIFNHELEIFATHILETDEGMIPTGKLRHVEQTPFDFRIPKRIGLEIGADDIDLQQGNGYDHCFALDHPDGQFSLAATAYDPVSGRLMELFTDKPGLQLYTANWLNHSWQAKGSDVRYGPRTAFCLEPQLYPDAPNRPEFKSPVLSPGEVYLTRSTFRFGVK